MPRPGAADKAQTTFTFPQNKFEAGSGAIRVTTEATPVVFELDKGVACANSSHWGNFPNACPFWGASSGGHVSLRDGSTLLTSVVAYLGGSEGGTKANAGIYAFVSNDTLTWKQRSHIVTIADFPDSAEGASENSIARMSNGSLLVVFRLDGGDGQLYIQPPCPDTDRRYPGCLYKNYHRTVSSDEGHTWGRGQEIVNAGTAFPRVINLGGQLLLSGGRSVNRGRWDISLWISKDGLGDVWEEHSLTALHNERIGDARSKIYTCTDVREKCSVPVGEKIPLRLSPKVNTTEFTSAYTSLVALDAKTALVVYGRRTWPASFAMRISL